MNVYRKAIDSLGWGDAPAVVIGHKTPDGDSVMSALAYAYLMDALGHKTLARMAGKANNETVFAAKAFGIDLPETLLSIETAADPVRLILMDHSDYAQAVDGARNARILQVIDHHGIGDITESKLLFAKYMPVGSTCSIVYTSYKELGVEITADVAKILFAGILSDTLNLIKVTTTDVDRQIYEELLQILANAWNMDISAARNKVNEIYKGMVEAAHDFSSMSDEEIFNSDAKDYVMGGAKFRLGSLDWKDSATIDQFAERMLRVMPSIMEKTGNQMIFCRVGYEEKTCMVYYGTDAAQTLSIAEKAFGKSKCPGMIFVNRRLSRKLDVVPMLTKALN